MVILCLYSKCDGVRCMDRWWMDGSIEEWMMDGRGMDGMVHKWMVEGRMQ